MLPLKALHCATGCLRSVLCIGQSAIASGVVTALQYQNLLQEGLCCNAGETPPGGLKLARTPIGTPRLAQPGSTRLDASPAHVPHTAAKAGVQGIRSEARIGHQLARTPAGVASANRPALLASHLAGTQGTPGGPAASHSLLACMQEDWPYIFPGLMCSVMYMLLPAHTLISWTLLQQYWLAQALL